MRERLIEIIKKVPYGVSVGAKFERHFCEKVADCLLENGVIVPPCYIGQEIWHMSYRFDGRVELKKGKVSMLQQKADKSWKIRITVRSSVWDFTPNEIGKIYFLTKEEAEKALAEVAR